MKKSLLLRLSLLAAVFLCGWGNIYADETEKIAETGTFSSSNKCSDVLTAKTSTSEMTDNTKWYTLKHSSCADKYHKLYADATVYTPVIDFSKYSSIKITISSGTFGTVGKNDFYTYCYDATGTTQLGKASGAPTSSTAVESTIELKDLPTTAARLSLTSTLTSNSTCIRLFSVTIEGVVAGSELPAPTFEFTTAAGSVSVDKGTFTLPALSYNGGEVPSDVAVTYTSGDESVATVEAETGIVSLVSSGTVTITATAAESETNASASATFTLTVLPDERMPEITHVAADSGPFVLATKGTTLKAGDQFLLVGYSEEESNNAYVMSYQKSGNRKGITTTIVDNKIESTTYYTAIITLQDAGSGKFYLCVGDSILYGGDTSNQLKTDKAQHIDSNNHNLSKATISIGDDDVASVVIGEGGHATLQFNQNKTNDVYDPLFNCYASASQKPVYIFYRTAKTTTPLTIGSQEGYGTYYVPVSVRLQPGMLAGTVSEVSEDGTMAIDYRYNGDDEASSVIPAATPVIVKAQQGTYQLEVVDATPVYDAPAPTALLRGTFVDALTTGGEAETAYKFYKMTYASDADLTLGFYWGEDDGAAFTNAAHRCFLALPEGSGADAVRGFAFESAVTGIAPADILQTQGTPDAAQGVYDLQGRRCTAPARGLYIVNGRKVIVK